MPIFSVTRPQERPQVYQPIMVSPSKDLLYSAALYLLDKVIAETYDLVKEDANILNLVSNIQAFYPKIESHFNTLATRVTTKTMQKALDQELRALVPRLEQTFAFHYKQENIHRARNTGLYLRLKAPGEYFHGKPGAKIVVSDFFARLSPVVLAYYTTPFTQTMYKSNLLRKEQVISASGSHEKDQVIDTFIKSDSGLNFLLVQDKMRFHIYGESNLINYSGIKIEDYQFDPFSSDQTGHGTLKFYTRHNGANIETSEIPFMANPEGLTVHSNSGQIYFEFDKTLGNLIVTGPDNQRYTMYHPSAKVEKAPLGYSVYNINEIGDPAAVNIVTPAHYRLPELSGRTWKKLHNGTTKDYQTALGIAMIAAQASSSSIDYVEINKQTLGYDIFTAKEIGVKTTQQGAYQLGNALYCENKLLKHNQKENGDKFVPPLFNREPVFVMSYRGKGIRPSLFYTNRLTMSPGSSTVINSPEKYREIVTKKGFERLIVDPPSAPGLAYSNGFNLTDIDAIKALSPAIEIAKPWPKRVKVYLQNLSKPTTRAPSVTAG